MRLSPSFLFCLRIATTHYIARRREYHETGQDNIYKHASIYGIYAFEEKTWNIFAQNSGSGWTTVTFQSLEMDRYVSVDLEKGDFVLEYQLYIYMDG